MSYHEYEPNFFFTQLLGCLLFPLQHYNSVQLWKTRMKFEVLKLFKVLSFLPILTSLKAVLCCTFCGAKCYSFFLKFMHNCPKSGHFLALKVDTFSHRLLSDGFVALFSSMKIENHVYLYPSTSIWSWAYYRCNNYVAKEKMLTEK